MLSRSERNYGTARRKEQTHALLGDDRKDECGTEDEPRNRQDL